MATTLQQIQSLADQAMAGAPPDLTPYIYSTHVVPEFNVAFVKILKAYFAELTKVTRVRVDGEINGKAVELEFRTYARGAIQMIIGGPGAPRSYHLDVEPKNYRPLRLRKYKSLVRDWNGVTNPRFSPPQGKWHEQKQLPPSQDAFNKSLSLVNGFFPPTKPGK